MSLSQHRSEKSEESQRSFPYELLFACFRDKLLIASDEKIRNMWSDNDRECVLSRKWISSKCVSEKSLKFVDQKNHSHIVRLSNKGIDFLRRKHAKGAFQFKRISVPIWGFAVLINVEVKLTRNILSVSSVNAFITSLELKRSSRMNQDIPLEWKFVLQDNIDMTVQRSIVIRYVMNVYIKIHIIKFHASIRLLFLFALQGNSASSIKRIEDDGVC